MASIDEIAASPDWLPQHYDARRDLLTFVWLPKEAQRAVTFLSDEYLGQRPTLTAPPAAVRAASTAPPRPADFIFHTAFCCSTLLARAMDRPDRSFGLKEPYILIELAEVARQGRLAAELLTLVLDLLGRPFAPEERIVIKAGNDANLLIAPILAASPASRALLLSSGLDDFLLSVAKKGMWGRLWARRTFARLQREAARAAGFSQQELFEQTDLQIAALAWLQQRTRFAELVARFPDRLATLDSATFLANPSTSLKHLDDHFGLPAPTHSEVGAEAVFREHAKELGRSYDAETRDREQARMRSVFGEEIAMVVQWADRVAAHLGIAPALAQPLSR